MTAQLRKEGERPREYLTLHVPGATEEQLQRGIEAAWKVINDAGVTAYEAADADWVREGYWMGTGIEFTDRQNENSDVWGEAHEAAVAACCEGWDKIPEGCNLK